MQMFMEFLGLFVSVSLLYNIWANHKLKKRIKELENEKAS